MMMRKLSFIWSNDQIWHKKAKKLWWVFLHHIYLRCHIDNTFDIYIIQYISHKSNASRNSFFLPIFNHSACMLIPSKCLMIHINNKPILLSCLVVFCCVDVVFDVNSLLYILVIVVYEFTFTLFLIIIETILISHCCGFLFTVF